MLYQATHTTRYHYKNPASLCFSQTHLAPRDCPGQQVLEFRLDVEPEPVTLDERIDYFGNRATMLTLARPHSLFVATGRSVVRVDREAVPPPAGVSWEQARDLLAAHEDEESLAAYEFVFDSPFVPLLPELPDYAQPSFAPGRDLAEAAIDLSNRIHHEFRYNPKATSIETPLSDVLRLRRGVCQDFSHLMIGALRSVGLAARYVSGYLRSGVNYQGAEASHAWVAVFVPGYGWLDLDPTNAVIPGEGHVTVAWGRDYGDVTPVNGIALGGGKQTVKVEVRVEPIAAPPDLPQS